VLEAAQAEDVFRRLDAYAHLVAVVGPSVGEPVYRRADEPAENAAVFGDLEGPLAVAFETVHADELHGHRLTAARPGQLEAQTSVGVDFLLGRFGPGFSWDGDGEGSP